MTSQTGSGTWISFLHDNPRKTPVGGISTIRPGTGFERIRRILPDPVQIQMEKRWLPALCYFFDLSSYLLILNARAVPSIEVESAKSHYTQRSTVLAYGRERGRERSSDLFLQDKSNFPHRSWALEHATRRHTPRFLFGGLHSQIDKR